MRVQTPVVERGRQRLAIRIDGIEHQICVCVQEILKGLVSMMYRDPG